MKHRNLFQAKDDSGKLHYIDNLDKKAIKSTEFYCPHCSNKVLPKMGQKNVWHFSHVDKPCKALKISQGLPKDEKQKTKDLWSFTKKFTVGSDFKLDKKSYQCEVCKNIQSKKEGIKWGDEVYLCKECYQTLDTEKIESLQWKSM